MNPELYANSIMTIFKGNGVKVVGVLLAVVLFQGAINFWMGKETVSVYRQQHQSDSLTIAGKDKQLEFFRNFMIENSRATRKEANEIRERNQAAQDSLIKFVKDKK